MVVVINKDSLMRGGLCSEVVVRTPLVIDPIARYSSSIAMLPIAPAFDAPVRGVPIGILPRRFVWKN